MRVIGLVFSARKKGNCYHCVNYCLEKFKTRGFKTQIINAYDYEIKPCSHCNYQCFSEEVIGKKMKCPIDDDLPNIYEIMREADILIFGIPTYGGHASGLYRAFMERMNSLSHEDFIDVLIGKVKGFIIIGNLTAWGDLALHEVLVDFYNSDPVPEAILLQARDYGRNSLEGDLIEESAVRQRLNSLVSRLIKRFKSQ